MNRIPSPSKRSLIGLLALVVVLMIGVAAYWKFVVSQANVPTDAVAADDVVADFFVSLAALDVEENEMAARVLGQAVKSETREPALWANLAVAHLRLRDLEKARQALDRAVLLAKKSRELALLRAEFLEHSGDTEQAIEQLRDIHRDWPENLAVTYSLSSLLGQILSHEASVERLSLLSDILTHAPGNLRARCEQAHTAATLERGEQLQAAVDMLLRDDDDWPDAARQFLTKANTAAGAGDYRSAKTALKFLENLLMPLPDYQDSLPELGISSLAAIGTPLRSFVYLQLPATRAADADTALTFESLDFPKTTARLDLVLALEQPGERFATLWSLAGNTLQSDESASLPFPGSSIEASTSSIAAADLNFDFQQDLILVGAKGCRIFLASEDGSYAAQSVSLDEFNQPWRSVWAIDVEADGDLDLLLSDHETPLRWIRNNGDMTFVAMSDFAAPANVRDLLTADFDEDGDLDLVLLETAGTIAVWWNERGGKFVAGPPVFQAAGVGFAVGDVDRDGRFDVVSLAASGELRKSTLGADGKWVESLLATWSPSQPLADAKAGDVFLKVADVDNNGGADLIASAFSETAIWLSTADGSWESLAAPPQMRATSAVDVDNDGLIDLVGLTIDGARVAKNRSRAGYGWHVIQPLASTSPGDRRINSFGVGGRINIRAGDLVQSALIQSPRVHFGLGSRKHIDVARIQWPNGTFQAEFELPSGAAVVATQRLKSSCPWVFAFDGREFRFVKDFIWRSPLGLRINAQETAGVAQTEDWIKIPGEYLSPVDGRHLVRITAELWETHFFDHVSLLAVDHPADVDVFVDERFVPNENPARRVVVATPPRPLENVADHRGQSMDDAVRTIDGVYADSFALGKYQGVAEEHWIEFNLPADVASDRAVILVGNGWIYPTDSSLNVALAQGSTPQPFGLILEQQDASGQWRTVQDNLGFPAGKNKDVIIPLDREWLAGSRRFRLKTNMEIYFDAIGWGYEMTDVTPRVTELPVRLAELRLRGYSRLLPVDRRRPDTPTYEVRATAQCWLDLEGYYTRFGDVRELLADVDDRYVIMNAGDELVFEFDDQVAVDEDLRRDFVLVGDGWVKDGDFNTAFSRTVGPLPAHDDRDYSGPLEPLEDDPVFRRHADDWREFHTRYVTPRRLLRLLGSPSRQPVKGDTVR